MSNEKNEREGGIDISGGAPHVHGSMYGGHHYDHPIYNVPVPGKNATGSALARALYAELHKFDGVFQTIDPDDPDRISLLAAKDNLKRIEELCIQFEPFLDAKAVVRGAVGILRHQLTDYGNEIAIFLRDVERFREIRRTGTLTKDDEMRLEVSFRRVHLEGQQGHVDIVREQVDRLKEILSRYIQENAP